MGQEIELKFSLQAHDLAEIKRHPLIKQYAEQDTPVVQKIQNLYFDTSAFALWKEGMALRIRTTDGVFEQTIKNKGSSHNGLHIRDEWTHELSQPHLELALFPAAVQAMLQPVATQLHPIFDANFSRLIWLLNVDQMQVECAVDVGQVCAKGRCEDICELELELKQGTQQQLLSFVEQFQQHAALLPENRSKAACGYQLCGGCFAD